MSIKANNNLLEEIKENITLDNEIIHKKVKKIVESLLFSSPTPIKINKIKNILKNNYSLKTNELQIILQKIKYEYEKRESPLELVEIANGFLLQTKPEYSFFVEKLFLNKKPDRLSKSTMEVLAIIAYKQPITKAQIDAIRGVDCSYSLHQLIDKELIEISGKLETIGRPSLYKTSDQFLAHFGLKNIKELKDTSSLDN